MDHAPLLVAPSYFDLHLERLDAVAPWFSGWVLIGSGLVLAVAGLIGWLRRG